MSNDLKQRTVDAIHDFNISCTMPAGQVLTLIEYIRYLEDELDEGDAREAAYNKD